MGFDWPSFLAGAMLMLFVDRLVGYVRSGARKVRKAVAAIAPASGKAFPKKGWPKRGLVRLAYKFDAVRGAHTLHLPISFRSEEYNAGRTPDELRAAWVKDKRDLVWRALHECLPTFARSIPRGADVRVARIDFVRIGPRFLDDDNLVSAFKGVRDSLCSFLVWGDQCDENIRQIGRADEVLRKRGVTWSYRQEQHAVNPKLYGVKLVIHCATR